MYLNPDDVYLVAEGELELSTILPDAANKIDSAGYLCKKRPGDIVTKTSSKQDAQRKVSLGKKVSDLVIEDVTIVSCSSTLLLSASQEKLNSFVATNPSLKVSITIITNSMISDKLAKIPFLCHVKDSQLSVLAAMCRYEVIDSSKVVFEEGSLGSKLYIVLNGEVSVHAESNDSPASGKKCKARALRRSLELQSDMYDEESTCVAKLGPGDYFGETSLLVNIPRTLTVMTTQKSLFLTVDKTDFENFLKVCSIKESIDELMKNRMIQMLSSLGIPFFVDISTDQLKSISKSLEIHEVDEDSIVFREGDVGDRFYIIFYGEVSIEACVPSADLNQSTRSDFSVNTNESSVNLGRYGPGNYFGEMALISDLPRSASVISRGKSILLSIEKKSFRELFLSDQKVLAEFQLRVLQDKAELSHLLSHPKGLAAFRQFLETSLANENLEFWEDCNAFRQSTFSSITDLNNAANAIYDKYCKEDSAEEVNIPSILRTALQDKIGNNKLSLDMFEDAQKEIYKVMSQDNYKRFKASQDFTSFFEQLGIVLNK